MFQSSTAGPMRYGTYLIVPDEGSTSGVISTPFSTVFEISNTASDMAADIQTDASARWRPDQGRMSDNCLCNGRKSRVPGQILQSSQHFDFKTNSDQVGAYRLPKPKQIVRGSASASSPKWRSGLNSEGLEYVRGSLSMNLGQSIILISIPHKEKNDWC